MLQHCDLRSTACLLQHTHDLQGVCLMMVLLVVSQHACLTVQVVLVSSSMQELMSHICCGWPRFALEQHADTIMLAPQAKTMHFASHPSLPFVLGTSDCTG